MGRGSVVETQVNPACSANFATIFERLRVVDDLKETVYGDGKPGLDKTTEDNTRRIEALTTLLEKMATAKAEETKTKEQQDHERRMETLRFRYSVALLSITSIVGIIQAIGLYRLGVK